MAEWIQLFVLARFGRPVLLFLVIYAALWIVARTLRVPANARATAEIAARQFLIATAAAAAVAFVSIAAWYANDQRYYDFAEPTMPAVSWMFEIGKPVYPPPEAAEQYAHIYGPMAFIPLAAAMRVFGTGLTVTKWIGAGAGILALWLLFVILRSRVGTRVGLLFTGYCALLLLIFRNAAFWVRPDSLELLCTSVGLWAALRRSRISWLALGLSAGVLWNLKFSGPLYSLPLFVLLLERTNRRQLILAIATAAVVVALPFVIYPNISFHDYRTWILLSASKGIVWPTLRQNLEWAVYLVAPLILAMTVTIRSACAEAPARSRRSASREGGQQPLAVLSPPVAISLAASLASVAVLASKPGAGPYHLLPFLPVIVFFTCLQLHHLQIEQASGVLRFGVSFTLAAVLIALAQQTSFIETVREIDAAGPIADVKRFLDAHPSAVTQIGYSSDERMTFARPVVVFRSGMYLLDQPAIQEHQLAGVEIPNATEETLRSCAVTYWLIPKTGEPFSAVNRYPMIHGRPLFGNGFRRAFSQTYQKSHSIEYFDVWTCLRSPSEAPPQTGEHAAPR